MHVQNVKTNLGDVLEYRYEPEFADVARAEAPTVRAYRHADGRVGIWLIEFKLDRPAEEALAQIDERNYAEKYDFAGKTVRKLGISFSSEKRTIVDVKLA